MPRTVALTFDDGPDPVWTPAVLEALESHQLVATFFVVGERVAAHPQVVTETLARGHLIQPHCWSHVAHELCSREQIETDIDQVLSVLGAVGVPQPTLWRPPFGRVKRPESFDIAESKGLTLVGWTANSFDYEPSSTSDVMLHEFQRLAGPLALGSVTRALRRRKIPRTGRPGVSILMHDSRIATDRETCENTVQLIHRLAELGRRRGWRFEQLTVERCPDTTII